MIRIRKPAFTARTLVFLTPLLVFLLPDASVAAPRTRSLLEDVPPSISGTVLMPDGTPAADAPVMLFWRKPIAQTKTNNEGQFKVDLDVDQIKSDVGDDWARMALATAIPGTGPGWEILGRIESADSVTLRLVEDRPISGTILDQQGRPVAGATLAIQSLFRAPEENLDGFLKASRDQPTRTWLYARESMFYLSPETVLKLLGIQGQPRPTAVSDENGRVTFSGFGIERALLASVDGPGITRDSFYIVNRAEIDPRWKRGQPSRETLAMLDSGASMLSVYGANFHHLAAPAMTIHGRLTDASTGQPVAGMKLLANIRGSRTSGQATSDQDGRYEINGLQLEGELRVSALNPGDQPYLDAKLELRVMANQPPGPIDFQLDRGVRITGHVIDQRTGQGVPGNVGYLSWPNNEHLQELHQPYDTYNTMGTDASGNYTLVVPRGKGVLAFTARNRSQFDVADEADFGLPVNDDGFFRSGNSGYVRAQHYHFLRQLDPDEGQTEMQVDISVGGGNALIVEAVTSAGDLINEIEARGIIPNTLSGFRTGRFSVRGLQPGEQRTVMLRDRQHRYAGVFALRLPAEATDKPVQLRLEESAIASGRITDDQGRPRSRWFVAALSAGLVESMNAAGRNTANNRSGMFEFDESLTDADGYFRLKGLPPGVLIEIATGPREEGRRLEPAVIKTLSLRPGQTMDLGQLKIGETASPE